MTFTISVDDSGTTLVYLDNELLGPIQRLSLHTDSDGRSRVTVFLPKIPTSTPKELLSRLVLFKDHIREVLAPMQPWVEVVESDTITGMVAVREEG